MGEAKRRNQPLATIRPERKVVPLRVHTPAPSEATGQSGIPRSGAPEFEPTEEVPIRPKQAAQLAELDAALRAANDAARQLVQSAAKDISTAAKAMINGHADIADDAVVVFQGVGGTKDLPTLKYARLKTTVTK